MTTTCPYCRVPARLLPSSQCLYGRDFGAVWICPQPGCGARVGCHPNTERPLGTLARAELRNLRSQAHAVFDPLWRRKMRTENISKTRARRSGYAWLAEKLGIPKDEAHIALFNEEQCKEVIRMCAPFLTRRKQ